MLKITVSLIPGGVGHERKLGELRISSVAGGALADYQCMLQGNDLPEPLLGAVRRYPRWSSTVWDLVERAIATTLSGRERLPRRHKPLTVPVHREENLNYVRMSEIPEPVRSVFERRMRRATAPVITGEIDCVYAWDWQDFIGLGR